MAIEVTLEIFSGRPNPRQFLLAEAAEEFRQRLTMLPPMLEMNPREPQLGYRGFVIRDAAPPDNEVTAVYGGVVHHRARMLRDRGRALERSLFALFDDLEPAVRSAVERDLGFQ